MRRRLFLGALLAVPLRADPASEVWDALTEIASALGRGNAAAFAAQLAPGSPENTALIADVTALLREVEVQCSLDPIENEGDSRARTLVVDWLLTLTARSESARIVRRRENVRCRFEKRGRKWLLTRMDPAGFLQPPAAPRP